MTSLSVRTAWIEILMDLISYYAGLVAVRKDSVD